MTKDLTMAQDHHQGHTKHRLILSRISKDIGVAAFLAFFGSPVPVIAAEPTNKCMTFETWTDPDAAQHGMPRDYIFADGPICQNTPRDLRAAIDKANAGPGTTVVLNSLGGGLTAGVEMGRIIRDHRLNTQVGAQHPDYLGLSPVPSQDNSTATGRDQTYVSYLQYPVEKPFPGHCISACNFAFLGGVHRTVGLLSDFGAHQFYKTHAAAESLRKELLNSNPEVEVNNKLTDRFEDDAERNAAELAIYLQDMGIDERFLKEMVKKRGEHVWNVTHLGFRELIDLRVVTPRWNTGWGFQIAHTPSREVTLHGETVDMWGHQVLDVVCTKGDGDISSANVYLKATLDPGGRVSAAEFAKDITGYTLVLDNFPMAIPTKENAIAIETVPTEDGRKISATITMTLGSATPLLLKTMPKIQDQVVYWGNDNIGIMLESNKNPTVRDLQFVWTLNSDKMKSFLKDCASHLADQAKQAQQ